MNVAHADDMETVERATAVARMLAAAEMPGQASRIVKKPGSDSIRMAAETLSFHIATGRGTPEKVAALRGVIGLAIWLGCEQRALTAVAKSWEQAAVQEWK